MTEETSQESFEAFKKSFSYGSRSDLNFKFLSNLPDEEAGRFFQDLLWKLADALDDGDLDRLAAHVHDWQVRAYSGASKWAYNTGPFTPLRKPLAESRLVLMASSGHFVADDDPRPFGVEHMSQAEAAERIMDFIRSEPVLSAIPVDTPREKLRVRHGGYDVRGARADPNVALPYELLVAMAREGRIGELASDAYSFVGACSQRRLLKTSGPKWLAMLQEQQVDAALLVPV